MIDLFLKAKHWQLFLLMVGIPIIFQIVVIQQMFTSISAENEPDIDSFINIFKIFPYLMIVVMGSLYGWLWSVGVGLGAKLPEELKMNTNWFKLSIILPIVYLIYFSYLMSNMFVQITQLENTPNFSLLSLILPLHIIAMVCGFYNIYFVAKTIKTAELKRKVQFGDYVGEFFLLWFYFIGVWILQPKVNNMVGENTDIV